MSSVPVTLLTGFLGSGKTTLLNALLKQPGLADTAVIVNEFGEIGLDGDLVGQSDETVVQLENGCLCCTVKSDLIDTFRDLHLGRLAGTLPRFERLIIETTGIADPVPIMQIILTNPLVTALYRLDGVVTTVDAVNGLSSLERFPESAKQVAVADRVVLTKTDLVAEGAGQAAPAALRERIRALNPGVTIIEASPANVDLDGLFGAGLVRRGTREADLKAWLRAEAEDTAVAISDDADPATREYYRRHGHQAVAHHDHDPSIRTFCLVRDEPIALDTLRLFFEALGREAGPNLLRIKGVVNVAERPDTPAVIQGAQMVFHSLDWLGQWPSADRRTRIVFITCGIERSYIEDVFDMIERIAARTARAAQGG